MLRQKAPGGKIAAPATRRGGPRTGLTGNRNMLFGLHALVTGAFDAD
jgi:hypothetical protein